MAKAQAPAIGIDLGTTYRWGAAQCCGSAALKLCWRAPARKAGRLQTSSWCRHTIKTRTCWRRTSSPGWMLVFLNTCSASSD